MKTLQKIQEENRKFIIMANNPSAETYEEALKRELRFGCIVKVAETIEHFDEDFFIKHSNRESYITLGYYGDVPLKCIKIIGKPLTLNRVLISICEVYAKIEHSDIIDNIYIYDIYEQEKIKWDLTKEALEEQSEETQRKINALIK